MLSLLLRGPAAQEAPPEPSQTIGLDQWLLSSTPSLLQALLVTAGLLVALRLARVWLDRALVRARVDTGTRILVLRFVSIGLLVLGGLWILAIVGVSPAALVTVLGAVGLAFSLAIQDILKNFFSGVYLLLERPFRVGDTIRVKDQQGTVEHIGVRTTLLRTPENVQVLVPNAIVFAEVVSNHTAARPSAASLGAATPTGGSATPTGGSATPGVSSPAAPGSVPPAEPPARLAAGPAGQAAGSPGEPPETDRSR